MNHLFKAQSLNTFSKVTQALNSHLEVPANTLNRSKRMSNICQKEIVNTQNIWIKPLIQMLIITNLKFDKFKRNYLLITKRDCKATGSREI